jgi:hypothetical protein
MAVAHFECECILGRAIPHTSLFHVWKLNDCNHVGIPRSFEFGGVGYSGIGHYYGKDGFDALSHAKSILVSPPDVAIEQLFPPYTPEKVQELNQWFEY